MASAELESARMRRTMGELVALSTLPSVWAGSGPRRIADDLAEILFRTLELDFVYVGLAGRPGEPAVEAAHAENLPGELSALEWIRPALAPWLDRSAAEFPSSLADPQGRGTIYLAVQPLGMADEYGLVVAGSRHDDFPTADDRALLSVGANQAASFLRCRQVETALHQREEQFGGLFRQAIAGIAQTDLTGRFHLVNERYCQIVGRRPEELYQARMQDITHPDDLPANLQKFRELVEEGTPFRIEKRYVRPDGSHAWVNNSVSLVRDESGQAVAAVAVVLDIAEQKRSERRRAARMAVSEILAESATLRDAVPRLLGAICDSLEWDVGALWEPNSDGTHLTCLEVRARQGCEAAEFERATRDRTFARGVGLPGRIWSGGTAAWVADVNRDDNFPRAAIAGRAGLHGAFGFPVTTGAEFLGVFEFFSRQIREPDGDLLEMMTTVGSQVGQFIRRKRTEEQLRCSQRELSDFLENATEGVHRAGPDGTILWANRAELELLGYTREEYVGRNIAEFHADPEVIGEIMRRLKAGEELRNCEARLRCKDGSLRHVLINSNVLRDEGRFVYTRCFTRDVTDRKSSEVLLAGQKRALEHLLAGATIAEVLEALCETVEQQAAEPLIASVLLMDEKGGRLWPAAGQRCPQPYVDAITPVPVGPAYGSCGTAAHLGQRVIVADLAGDPLWATVPEIRDLAIAHGLRACWSTPIQSSSGEVLGTFAIYSPSPRMPSERDLRLVDVMAGTAGVAIEHQRTTQALRRSEERFRSLFTSISEGFALDEPVYDANGNILDFRLLEANPAFYSQSGFSDAVGRSLLELIPEIDRAWIERFAAVLRTGEPVRFEEHIASLGKWFEVFASRVDAAEGPQVAVLFSDVTARKHAEQSLRESEEQFHALADHIGQLAWMADGTGSIFWYNRRWFEYTGTTLEEMRGWGWQKAHHPDHVDRVVERIRRCFESGEVWEDTFPLRGRDGSYRWFLSRAFPIRGADGKVVRWFGTNTDVTEQEQAAEALREADRRKDEFLATLSHELRNPLAPIRSAVQILRAHSAPGSPSQTAADVIDRQARQMTRLIDDLLDVSRISRGVAVLRKEPLELSEVVRRAVETVAPLIEQRHHELTLTLPHEPVRMEADAGRLEQILVNLITNAAKYTPPGGRIWLTAERTGDDAIISVRDTGIGMAPEFLVRAFEMFSQAEHGKELAGGGLGIGLSLVRRLVEMHGGTISVDSPGLNQGCEFCLRLPALAAVRPQRTTGGKGGVSERSEAAHRILIVDDNRDAATCLATLLRLQGNDVHTTYDGPSALEAAAAYRPDVVLLDIGLPGMSGHEVCRELRQQPGLENAVLIAVTGWGQDDDRRRSREAGFDAHLVKPVELKALRELLPKLKRASSSPDMKRR